MHPRIVTLAIAGVFMDLLCIAAVAAVLLTYNPWTDQVGAARLALIALVAGMGLVPMMYLNERSSVALRLGRDVERVKRRATGDQAGERGWAAHGGSVSAA